MINNLFSYFFFFVFIFLAGSRQFLSLFVKAGKCKNKRRELPSNKTYSLIGRQLIEIRSVCDVIQVCG